MAKYIVEDGVILHELHDGDRLIRKNSLDALKTAKYEDFMELNNTINVDSINILRTGDRFVKMYIDSIKKLIRENLSKTDFKLVLVCVAYVRYESGLISYSNNKNFNIESFSKESGLSKRSVINSLASLVDKKILGRTKVGKEYMYVANPYIFCCGTKINKTLSNMFKKSKWR